MPKASEIPEFDQLTSEEQFGIQIIYDGIVDNNAAIGVYPKFLEQVTLLGCTVIGMDGATLTDTDNKLNDKGRQLLNAGGDHAASIIRTTMQSGIAEPSKSKVSKAVDDLDWHIENPDPDLWHILAECINYDNAGTEAFLHFIIDHPSCDRATAAFLFLTCNGEKFLTGDPDIAHAAKNNHFTWKLTQQICSRSEILDGFPQSELTLSEHGLANDQRAFLERIAAAHDCSAPVPHKLFAEPFEGRAAKTPHVFIGDNGFTTGV